MPSNGRLALMASTKSQSIGSDIITASRPLLAMLFARSPAMRRHDEAISLIIDDEQHAEA